VHTRQLGTSDLQITRIGFGAWAIGGPDYAFGWGPQDDDDSVAAIHKAIDAGINWIDTAPVYGLGRSERVVARALTSLPSSRRPYVFTKCSLVWNDKGEISHALNAESLRREVDRSLLRLGVDTIDLYQVHWPKGFEAGAEATDIEEGWSTLAELKIAGKLRHIGVSNFDAGQMERAQRIAPITSLQPPYSLLRRGIEAEILPWCRQHRTGVLVYSPMAAGILSGAMTRERASSLPANDWRSRHPELQEPKLTRNLALVDRLREIGAARGVTAGAAAIAWTLHHPDVTAAIVGFRTAAQIDAPIAADAVRFSDEELKELGERTAP
jgi:aryl-alcohol dehydrogenase-like predicted oxidoreductase